MFDKQYPDPEGELGLPPGSPLDLHRTQEKGEKVIVGHPVSEKKVVSDKMKHDGN